jgi:hypothetical protein
MHPSLGCMLPYHLGQKFDYDDDIIIVLDATSKKITMFGRYNEGRKQ